MKPIIKWAGGKTKLIPGLRARMPKSYARYHEPFLGGGALFFELGHADAFVSDVNRDLIRMYQSVRNVPNLVCDYLEIHKRHHGEEHYYSTRSAWNLRLGTSAERAAMFIYLNKACYNGLWRVNSRGELNVPFGKADNPKIFDVDEIQSASRALSGSSISHGTWQSAFEMAVPGDFVYVDSPYDCEFTKYAAAGFTLDHQVELAAGIRKLVDDGIYVMASNSDTPFIRSLYAGMRIDSVWCGRAINSKGTGRGKVPEIIITGGYSYDA